MNTAIAESVKGLLVTVCASLRRSSAVSNDYIAYLFKLLLLLVVVF